MQSNKDLKEYVLSDLMRGIEGISSKGMFGGFGLYQDGIIFGLITDGKLWFKVDEGNRADFEKFGSLPFSYPMKNGKTNTISFWELPADIMENRDQLEIWIQNSVDASLRSKKRK